MRFLLLLFLSAFAINAQATIHTVSNDPDNPGQYTTVQAAHDAASSGDTLYITPSETTYPGAQMNRELVIIGNGYVPVTQGQIEFETEITSISLSASGFSSSSNSSFIGLKIGELKGAPTDGSILIENILVRNCEVDNINGYRYYDGALRNLQVIHSIVGFSGVNWQNWQALILSATFRNSIITDCSRFYTDNTSGSEEYGQLLFQNCLFVAKDLSTINFQISDVIIENSIFIETDIEAEDIIDSDFSNNIIFNGTGDPIPFNTNDNTGSGNLDNTNPQFISYDAFSGFGYSPIDTEDWHLSSGSPGILYGTDGTDVGIYGGQTPWPEVSGYTGRPSMPVITLFQLLNGVVSPDGELEFEIEATTQN